MRRRRRNPDLEQVLLELRPKFARAAQGVYDAWDQDDEGMDDEYGVGGICHDIAAAMVDVVYENLDGVEAYSQDSGGMGEQHVWMVAHDDERAFIVDIPPGTYETGAGYNWRKISDVDIDADDVIVEEMDREFVVDEDEFYNNPDDLLEELPETRREVWDDGTVVVFGPTPFPKESRKPWVPARALDTAEVVEISLDTVRATQSEVTHHGVEKYLPRKTNVPYHDLPIVLFKDGVNYIQDGHHRLVAAFLRGDRTALVRQVDVDAAIRNPSDSPIIIVGIGPANRHLLGDQVLPAMEQYPELEPLMEELYAGNFELYDMDQLPEKGDALDAVTDDTPLVITHNIYGIDPGGDFKYSAGYMYNRGNEFWLPMTNDMGVPLLVIGELPYSGKTGVGLYNMPRKNPLPPMKQFRRAARDVLDADWSGRGFVGRDELVAAVLARMGYGECAQAADAAERALLDIAGRENPGCIVYDRDR